MPIKPHLLHGSWLHSHEEDSPGRLVFRPASHAFPPSRGRRGFDLQPGGTFIDHGIGPTDRRTTAPGMWKVENDQELSLSTSAGRRSYGIVSLDGRKLVLEPRTA